ncbi:MAG: 6-phosphogluconolactonase, partial [Opitutaceae bacterium]|nr:6-phosphogluconolactonase [Cytophagales bacterium]
MKSGMFEKLRTSVFESSEEASKEVAAEIALLIKSKQNLGQSCVLGLATGSTPKSVYAELIRLHKEENLSFTNVATFNLDEYYPISPEALQSYFRFMHEHLFDHIDIEKQNINIPDGTI